MMTLHNYRIMRMILLLVVGMLTLLAGAVAEDSDARMVCLDDNFKVWTYDEDGIIATNTANTDTYNMTTEIYQSSGDFALRVMFPGPAGGGWQLFGVPNCTLYINIIHDDQILYMDCFKLQMDQAVLVRYAAEADKQSDFGYIIHLDYFPVPEDARYLITEATIRTEDGSLFNSTTAHIIQDNFTRDRFDSYDGLMATYKVSDSAWMYGETFEKGNGFIAEIQLYSEDFPSETFIITDGTLTLDAYDHGENVWTKEIRVTRDDFNVLTYSFPNRKAIVYVTPRIPYSEIGVYGSLTLMLRFETDNGYTMEDKSYISPW